MHQCWAVLPPRGGVELTPYPVLFSTQAGADSYAALFGGTVTTVRIMTGSWVEAENSWISYDPTPVED